MCGKIWKKIIFLIILLECQRGISTYNLSPKPSLVLERPKIEIFKNKTRSSYFGFSIVLREKSAFISAPRDQASIQNQSLIHEPGAVYKCALDNSNCKPIYLDTNANVKGKGTDSEIRDYQWLGATMTGGPLATDPLVVCAPGFIGDYDLHQHEVYMHGICYVLMYDQEDKPMVKRILVLNQYRDRRLVLINGKRRPGYSMGQQGFSAHITKSMDEILMGAPGINDWSGSVVFYDRQNEGQKIPDAFWKNSAYFGYAVSSGHLEAKETKKIHYVATATHAFDGQSNINDGMVLVFDLSPNGQVVKKLVLNALQFGEYFGYSLLVEDVTGDDLDEIIVSAPYHQEGGIDTGAVYYYINNGDFRFLDAQKISSPFKTKAQFGTTMAKLGDINRDGFNDIAIAAPFADESGGVAIYLGSADGLPAKPSQILRQPTSIALKMFGHGLSHGFDIDDNGFNDFAIGAPEAEQVFIYQTYPIVDVVVSINAANKQRRVPLDDTLLILEFCYEIKTKAKHLQAVEIIMEIQVDPIYKRITLDNGQHYADPYAVNVTKTQACLYENATIKTINADLFRPMPLQINFTLMHDAELYESDGFCEKCVVLDRSSRRKVTSDIIFDHGCDNKTCNVDLEIIALDVPETFTVGLSNTLFANYFIQNHGQNAFDTIIEFRSQFPFAKVPPACVPDILNATILSCSINGTRSFKGNMTLEIGFDVKSVQDVKAIDILAKATSAGHEENPLNNELTTTIYFQANTSFEVIGKPNNTFESIFNGKHAMDVIYAFELQNNGPSVLNNLYLNFAIPAAYKIGESEKIRFVNVGSSRAYLIRDEIQYKTVLFTKRSIEKSTAILEPQIINHHRNNISIEHKHFEGQILPGNSTISLYCNHTNDSDCVYARLNILSIKPKEKLLVNLFINIETIAVRKLLDKKFEYLQAFVNVFFEPSSKQYVNLNVTNIIDPLIFVNIGPEKTPIWIFIAAGVGGIAFLLILSLILKKLGFFKRQTKEEMRKIIDEKLEKEKMKAALEQYDDEKLEEIPLNPAFNESEGEA